MSDDQISDKDVDNDPERTLVTLDQLSQTIEVMTSVVNRLRRHLSEQIKAKMLEEAEAEVRADNARSKHPADNEIKIGAKGRSSDKTAAQNAPKRESFVVEISQQEVEPVRKTNKVLH